MLLQEPVLSQQRDHGEIFLNLTMLRVRLYYDQRQARITVSVVEAKNQLRASCMADPFEIVVGKIN